MNIGPSSKQKQDYQKLLDQTIADITSSPDFKNNKPSLLLHACCAPCSSYVLEYLSQYFAITIYYYNPNIHPQEEYSRRLQELIDFLPRFPQAIENKVKLVQADYNPEDFFEATKVRQEPQLQSEQERGERCRRCYKMRLDKAKDYALEHNFDYFTTTLSISPYKDAEKINSIGLSYTAEELKQTKYLAADFKKKSGFLRSTQISAEYGLWRQDYCGCIYSKINEELRRNSKNSKTESSPTASPATSTEAPAATAATAESQAATQAETPTQEN